MLCVGTYCCYKPNVMLELFPQDCLVIILNHEDVYSTVDVPSPLLQMEYLANIVIKAEPLATGLATDVHGQVRFFKNLFLVSSV